MFPEPVSQLLRRILQRCHPFAGTCRWCCERKIPLIFFVFPRKVFFRKELSIQRIDERTFFALKKPVGVKEICLFRLRDILRKLRRQSFCLLCQRPCRQQSSGQDDTQENRNQLFHYQPTSQSLSRSMSIITYIHHVTISIWKVNPRVLPKRGNTLPFLPCSRLILSSLSRSAGLLALADDLPAGEIHAAASGNRKDGSHGFRPSVFLRFDYDATVTVPPTSVVAVPVPSFTNTFTV